MLMTQKDIFSAFIIFKSAKDNDLVNLPFVNIHIFLFM